MFNVKSFCVAVLVIGGLFCTSVFSQPASDVLNEIISVANRVPVPVRQLGAAVSIIDRETIQAHGNVNLVNVLRQSTAVGASANGGVGTVSSLRIRGEEGFRTLVLMDGLRLSDPSAPQVVTPVEHIMSTGIERVEVLRGPQGLSYGADAGGVVALSSGHAGSGFTANVDLQAGELGSRQAAAGMALGNERVDLVLTASRFGTDGYNVRESDTTLLDDDGYDNDTLHAKLAWRLSDNARVQVVHRKVEGETEYDGCFAGVTVHDCDAVYELDASRLSFDYDNGRFTHSLAYSDTKTQREDFALGVSAFGSDGEIRRFEYVGSAVHLPGFDLVYGVDLEREESAMRDRNNKGWYVEYLSDFSRHFFLGAGVRRDDHDDFGKHDSYRVSSAWLFDLADGVLKLKASYGSGFRAPSLFEVDYNAGSQAFPPAADVVLVEEISRGFEYGVEWLHDDWLQLEAVVFDQKVEDAIHFDLARFSGYLQETGAATSRGVELRAHIEMGSGFGLAVNHVVNDTERPNGLQRLRRPEHLSNVGVRYRSESERFTFNAFYRRAENAIDEVFGAAVDLDDFGVLDLSTAWRINPSATLYARIENASNESYQEVSDYRSPERSVWVGVRLNFQQP